MPQKPPRPRLYVIAGPNGAGKTTYAREYLPEEINGLEFVNADLIAQGLSPFAPERASMRAGRLMLARLDELVEKRESFAFETTLSGRGYAALFRTARQAGYFIQLDFLWIPVLGISSRRMTQRVRKGGHDIPAEVQERRFFLGLQNLFSLYRPLVDHWRLFDNSLSKPVCIAEEEAGALTIHFSEDFDKLPLIP